MKVESTGAVLSTVFVDYDNIYLSLKRKNEEAAKRFAKDAALWLREIESGRLITPTNGASFAQQPRRIVMSRCYGNPVPRRNANDNSTDMNSFPFVRHHFLRAGFEVVDCPPLTAQLKNSADIRMVMDVRDFLNHETRFDEFILLSGDADFTPVLHRLRAHARRTVVFANDHTAQPYTAISDGEVREADLITLLLEGRLDAEARAGGELREPTSAELEVMRKSIVAEVAGTVRAAQQPVPLEALADRAVRSLGHDKTVGSGWGGAGSFRDLLSRALPKDIKLTDTPPYFAYEPTRQISRDIEVRAEAAPAPAPAVRERARAELTDARHEPRFEAPAPRYAEGGRAVEARPETQARYEPQRAERPLPSERDPRSAERPEPRYEEARYPQPRDARADFGDPVREAPLSADRRGDMAPARAPERPAALARAEAPSQGYGPPQGYYAPAPERAPLNAPSAQPQARQPGPGAPVAAPQAHVPYGARPGAQQPAAPTGGETFAGQQRGAPQPQHPPAQSQAQRPADQASQIQQSIARIHEACQAPPLSPPEYRVLFEVMAEEITTNNLSGQQTLINIVQRAREMGLEVRRDDVRFVLEVVSEPDPWFEQGASVNLFASRFRNFVVARCRSQGLSLSADEIDLIDAWFGGAPPSQRAVAAAPAPGPAASRAAPAPQPQPSYSAPPSPSSQGGWPAPDGRGLQQQQPGAFGSEADEEFPRIVRSRLRG